MGVRALVSYPWLNSQRLHGNDHEPPALAASCKGLCPRSVSAWMSARWARNCCNFSAVHPDVAARSKGSVMAERALSIFLVASVVSVLGVTITVWVSIPPEGALKASP